MKKFIKVCLITGLICVVVGLTVTVASGLIGGFTGYEKVEKVIINGKNIIDFKDKDGVIIKDEFDDDFTWYHGKHHNNHHKKHNRDGSECDENCLISLDGIKSVEINVTKAELTVEGFDKDGVLIDSECETRYYIDEDELKIFVEGSDEYHNVYVPTDMQDKEIEFVINGGEVELTDVKLNKLLVETNAGSFKSETEVATKLDVENMASEVEIILGNSIDDFDIEVECMTGEVNVDDNDFSGVFVEREIKNGNNKTVEIECKAGTVEIYSANTL